MDKITIIWCIEDVKSLDDNLTDEQAREVLRLAEKYHDCNIGISWDVLSYYISEVLERVSD